MKEQKPILLVEDTESDIFLMQRAFQKAGVPNQLFVTTDGVEAVAYLQGEGKYSDRKTYPVPAAMLLDIKMPKMNGFEVLKWLRADPMWKGLYVAVQTSSPRAGDIEQAYDLGANGFLLKPGALDDLIEMVRTLSKWLDMMQLAPIVETARHEHEF